MNKRTQPGLLGVVAFALALGACGKQESAGAPATPTTPAPAAAKAGPTAAAQGIDPAGAMHISPDDRCPVCAMKAAEHLKFASAIALKDGRTFYFCGTGCMIRSWLHPEVFLAVDQAQLERAVVPEYFGGQPTDAMVAHWVAGSDIVGPMGPAIVPLKSEADAATFVERHGGKHRFRLAEMDDARWRQITGKPVVPPKKK